ncbi:uncharacterized protein PHACADRAFT_169695 [Phanerochaete carnosa HHB-10118-sp]|uniref:Uncharacterized protein n=1 Tax=Phanerochaete carnosa (strain HHB-10118-sp) TaxID=650164 RepID=K5V8Q9_PHACS|nr:uncharacterized protein PHACADRAFT_169695 [Phanerochaete carnosa HHB-10118-sp]EKM59216.1 hypothetical protein PHACADRAFT_169695 [Phanerochaete carnosa HHB-10118-sp]
MEEEDSQARFTALISGTAADKLPRDSYIATSLKHRLGAGVREMSPGVYGGQNTRRTLLSVGPGGKTSGASHAAPGDLVRRGHRDGQRASLINAARFSSPLMQTDGERLNEDLRPHTPGEAMLTSSRPSQPRELVKLRTSKSLHQRSDASAPRTEYHGSGNPGGGPHRLTTHDNLPYPPTHSRSASVASFGNSVQDEDISSIMMRGANDLRNAKYEMEELRREVAFLKTQIDSTKSEKVELMQRIKSVKDAARQGLEATSRSLGGMRASMDGLKAQSDETFAFYIQAKAVMPDVKELRETVSESIKSLEAVLDEDGHLVEVTKTKEVLTELNLRCTGTMQVAEMLREKLQSVGADLIEAKDRVAELEGIQAADIDTLRLSSVRLSGANEQIQKFADAMKCQQTELHDALMASAELEAQLSSANERAEQLSQSIQNKDSELEAMTQLQSEVKRLEQLLGERDTQVVELKALRESFDSLTTRSTEQLAQVCSLEATIQARTEAIAQLEGRIANKESQYQESQNALQAVKYELGSATTQVASLQSDVTWKSEELKSLEMKLESSMAELLERQNEADRRSETMHDLETKYQVMEERYETQLMTTKCAQGTQVELQDRLIEAEKKFAHDLEMVTGKSKVEIAVLEQEKATLQSRVNDLEGTVRAQREEITTIKADYDGRVAKQEDNSRVQLELAEKRIGDVQSALDQARASVKSFEEQIASGKQEIFTLRQELREARLPDPAHKDAIDTLTGQISALRLENTELVLRARSIDARYRTGDLNEEEKTFINALIQTSQSIHEQELVSKGNELRRRDNTIKEQQTRIQVLEGTLAKHLKAMSKPIALPVTAAENRSLIDPTVWVASSDKSKSPPQTAEEDVTSTNVDNTMTARPTPAPVRPVAKPALTAVPQPDPNTKARVARTPAHLRPFAPAGAPTTKSSPAQPKKVPSPAGMPPMSSSPLVYPQPKTPAVRGLGGGAKKTVAIAHNAGQRANFRRLDTTMSDDIQDFEDKSRKTSPVGTPPEANSAEPTRASKKRDKPSDTASRGTDSEAGQRTSMRSRAPIQQDEPVLKVSPRSAFR